MPPNGRGSYPPPNLTHSKYTTPRLAADVSLFMTVYLHFGSTWMSNSFFYCYSFKWLIFAKRSNQVSFSHFLIWVSVGLNNKITLEVNRKLWSIKIELVTGCGRKNSWTATQVDVFSQRNFIHSSAPSCGHRLSPSSALYHRLINKI